MEREVTAGQLIAGKYRVEQVLGRGGMGVVMSAMHEHLNQRVALKFLTDNAYLQPEAVARFVREARAAVQIQSEHVARVMDVGTLDSGAPYMVMEHLRGRDLKEVSTRRGPLPVVEAVDYVLQACDAVAEAHSLGIVHRDLKPSNLFLTERPDGSPLVKVLDFGISKALHSVESSQMQMTATSAIMGSPQYMSPEQIRSSKNVDARADVWALGTILHELLTGAPAYVADTVPGLLAMIVADHPPPLSASRPDAPPDLEATILRCLEKDREKRFANVSEFARSLERFASSETKPLIRRIGRLLGDDKPGPSSHTRPGSFGGGFQEPVAQTNGTWTRTGRISDGGLAQPFYTRPTAQLGMGLGVVGIGVLSWVLFIRSAPSDAGISPAATNQTGTKVLSAEDTGTNGAGKSSGLPPVVSRPVETPPVAPIRPVVEQPVSRDPVHRDALDRGPVKRDLEKDDVFVADDPRTPVDEDGSARRASGKNQKGALRPKLPPPPRPNRGRAGVPRPVAGVEDSLPPEPTVPKKSSGTLDLFDDTK
jgi:serine/threonine protein kinase